MIKYGGKTFDEAVEFHSNKLGVKTKQWRDIWRDEHARAFMVAGAARDDLVNDLFIAVDKALADGTTLATFRADFDGIVKTHGWVYNGGKNWRSRLIYETNLRQARAAGRWKQFMDNKQRRPFLQYQHHPSPNERPEHKAWHGLILPVDDPFWDSHYPMNGWGCKCTVRSITAEQAAITGVDKDNIQTPAIKKIKDTNTGKELIPGISEGFDYNVGKAWMRPLTPKESGDKILSIATSIPSLPLPLATKVHKTRILQAGKTDEYYADKFLQEFDGKIGEVKEFTDKAGSRILISDELFKDYQGNWKIQKRDREKYLLYLADTIKDPDEIWVSLERINKGNARTTKGDYYLERRYLKRLQTDDGTGFVLFRWGKGFWSEKVTSHMKDKDIEFRKLRKGTLIYKKGKGD